MAGRFEGKTAVVTGSGQSIGRSVALLLAKEGANVVVNSRNERSRDDTPTAAETLREILGSGARAVAAFADVGTREGAEKVIDAAVDAFGGVDILINNAGGGTTSQTIEDIDEDAWDATLTSNLKSQYLLSRRCVPLMRRSGWGRIINMGSSTGLFGFAGLSSYAAAKAGTLGLTFSLAHELAGTQITANCVLPSAATTRNNRDRAERERIWGIKIPVTSERVPDAVAPLVAYLASNAAQRLSGQVYTISGGQITHHRWPPVEQTLRKTGVWTLDELTDRFGAELGADHQPVSVTR